MSRDFQYTGANSADEPENTLVRALPASWYRSPAMYELERRAIFSKKWLLVSHKLRFENAGDYLQITEAGYSFFLIRDRQGNINAFHNVCRHRAYPLVGEGPGKVSILACKYHGWSYGFNGKLAKAPKYQDLESFDKEANGLYPVHVHIDHLGFVWVNLDSKSKPTISWEDEFSTVDRQPRLEVFDMSQYRFDHQWEMLGDYNWKTLADNYNECYHCPTGHPAVSAVSDLSKYWVETKGGHIQHFNVDKAEKKGLGIFSSFLYPNACMTISEHFFYIMRCIPISATQTKMEYEVYRHKNASDEDFTNISNFFKQVLHEDKDLCNGAQKNLEGGVFMNGELHPEAEKGPLYFQQVTRDIVMTHRQEEEEAGREWWPAVPERKVTAKIEEEIRFCDGLDCANGNGSSAIEW
ncbi:iron-sulfur cluster-binding protein [Thozetella sp. PMI_491]|nr:iron-sulfur cluster-binding protein [Thozetella sp. PMI_491]